MKTGVGRPTIMHINVACQPGQGARTCRYLTMDKFGWGCVKLHPYAAAVVDSRVVQGTMTATGDNCVGLTDPETESAAEGAKLGGANL